MLLHTELTLNFFRISDKMDNLTRILNDKYADIVLPNTILLGIGMIVGAAGNLMVITLYALRIEDKKGERYFIPILAFLDFLGCTANGSFYTLDNIFLFIYPSDILCRILIFLLIFASGFSAHVLLVIALQRYLLICRPFGKQLTLFWRRVSLVIVTVVCLGYATPLLAIAGNRSENTTFLNQTAPTDICVLSVDSGLFSVIFFGLFFLITVVNLIATAGFYIPIIKAIYRSFTFKTKLSLSISKLESESSSFRTSQIDVNELKSYDNPVFQIDKAGPSSQSERRRENKLSQSKGLSKKRERARTRINLMFLIIIIVYVLSYIPTLALLVLTYTLSDFDYLQLSEAGINLWIFFGRFVILNHVVNPFIYGCFDVLFRKEFINLCFCRKRKRDYSNKGKDIVT